MKRRVLIECGAADTRAALLIGDEPVRFHFGCARGDEGEARAPAEGDLFAGRVRSVSRGMHAAFVDIGAGVDAFFPVGKRDKPPAEGALLAFIVRRPPIGDKGAVLARGGSNGPLGDAPGPLGPPVDAAVIAYRAVATQKPDEVIVSDHEAAEAIRSCAPLIAVQPQPFEKADIDGSVDAALERQLSLEAGGRLFFDENEGLSVIDVDSAQALSDAPGRLNDRVNAAAAAAIPGELARRAIGGRVIIDFLPPSGAAARSALVDSLKKNAAALLDVRIGRLSADGLLDLNIRRDRRSLLEQACERFGAGEVRPGLRHTLDWRAKTAIRALERSLAAARSARMQLACGPALAAFIGARPQWARRAASKYGARFDIIEDASLANREFDVRPQR